MDMRSGEVLYEKNADTRLYPASLTKMMTLYITFQAIEAGEVSLDSEITVSKNAASQPPSRLGLRAGQKIKLRYLIRAAAVKSANDAAAAIGDALGGNEENWAARMTATAKTLGMKNSTFKNANGLTREGHLSSAHDMTILGRHLFYDFPQYYNIFSRRSADAGMKTVYSTNRRFLDAYKGADGIKTGYTVASGFNLTASAQRGNDRIIATVFGGTSTAQRNAKMMELLDLGFKRVNENSPLRRPDAPEIIDLNRPTRGLLVANGPMQSSPRPLVRPGATSHDADAIAAAVAVANADPAPETSPVDADAVDEAVTMASAEALDASPRPVLAPNRAVAQAAPVEAPVEDLAGEEVQVAAAETGAEDGAPDQDEEQFAGQIAQGDTDPGGPIFQQTSKPQPETLALMGKDKKADTVILAALNPPQAAASETPRVVARASTSGGRNWGVTIGLKTSEFHAQQDMLKIALMESDTLGDALRKVVKRKLGYEATFVGMSQQQASLACARLAARSMECGVVGP
ncbi:D-alanyl-D-alanine carboxypeptidase family protein [Thioclava sp. GXIMD2076]|uniref:D-alanyl-D-alanine carboxypeptidase family protein n=1 Tax=Thioclava kandeliae TaxID=3070818 RepID=A0ABV1SDP1_9RHOB